jgi:ABC-type antimicrobial peptide transport system permease subunit
MISLLIRQLRLEVTRCIFTIVAIAAVVAEILILEGFLAGLYLQLREAAINRGGELIVTQAGVSNFVAARSVLPQTARLDVRSVLPQTARLDVEAVEGVRVAHPLTGISAIYEQNGIRTPIMIIVYDTAGGPTEIIAGDVRPGERGIIIDRALAVKHDLPVGSTMTISEFDFSVSAISTNSAAFMTPFAFITYDDLIDFYFESDIAADIATFPLLSFLLVELDAGAETLEVARQIKKRLDIADVHLPLELASNDETLGKEMLGPILGLLLIVSYGIGILVVGLFMYMAIRNRIRDLGILRALGFRARALSLSALLEAAFLAVLALPLGILLADLIASAIENAAPIYLILPMEPEGILRTSAIVNIDPAEVFRG